MNQFDYLISPLTRERFFNEYYEKRHVLIPSQSRTKFDHILKEEDLDMILTTQQLTLPKTRMAKKDGDLDPSKLAIEGTNIIDVSKVIEHFSEGATMILSSLHDRLPSLKTLCDGLTNFFGQPFQTNIYCTPGNGNQGFIIHHDTHDVFILQITGTKDWKIYESPINLAVKDQEFDKEKHIPGDVLDEFTMHPGDMLYIPRGLMHAAQTTKEKSIHVTTGLMGMTWQDILTDRIKVLTQEHEELRRGLKPDFWKNSKDNYYSDTYKSILDLLSNPEGMEEALKDSYKKMINRYRPTFVNPLKQAESISKLTLESQIQVVPLSSFNKEIIGDQLHLTLFNKEIELPADFNPVIDYIIEQKEFTLNQLPLLDDEGKIELIKTLIQAGFVECKLSHSKTQINNEVFVE